MQSFEIGPNFSKASQPEGRRFSVYPKSRPYQESQFNPPSKKEEQPKIIFIKRRVRKP